MTPMSLNHSLVVNKTGNPDRQDKLDANFQILIPISCLIVLGNSIALAVFLKKSFLVKKSTYLLVNLTVADLLVGITVLIHLFSTSFVEDRVYLTIVLNILPGFQMLATSASVITLALISLERVFAVFWPFHHRLGKRWHYLTAIAVVWILAGLSAVGYVILAYKDHLKSILGFFLLQSYAVVSLVAIFFSYLVIWIKVKFFTKFRQSRIIQESSQLTKTLFILTLVSLATCLPKLIVDMLLVQIVVIPHEVLRSCVFIASQQLLS